MASSGCVPPGRWGSPRCAPNSSRRMPSGATLMVARLHEGRVLTELEEGWLVRALYREHGLLQAAIAQRLGRHKSWVHRRLMLVEALDAAVQADVRLGLIAPRAAVVLGQLPRGNQHACAAVVVRRGLTVRQTELLIAELLECRDEAERAARIARYGEGPAPAMRPGVRPTRAARAEADWLAADVATVHRTAARLQARLLAAPVATHGAEAAELLVNALRGLEPVLGGAATQHRIRRYYGARRCMTPTWRNREELLHQAVILESQGGVTPSPRARSA